MRGNGTGVCCPQAWRIAPDSAEGLLRGIRFRAVEAYRHASKKRLPRGSSWESMSTVITSGKDTSSTAGLRVSRRAPTPIWEKGVGRVTAFCLLHLGGLICVEQEPCHEAKTETTGTHWSKGLAQRVRSTPRNSTRPEMGLSDVRVRGRLNLLSLCLPHVKGPFGLCEMHGPKAAK